MARTIGIEEMEYLAFGATILGAGGGGDSYIGKLIAQKAIKECGNVTLLSPEEIPDDELIITIAMMGAPTVFIEKIPNGDETLNSLRRLENYLGRKAYAVIPLECGGLNSTIPFVVAARANLPLVDADGMGRAFPELQMVTFNIYGLNGTPMVITDERGNWSLVNTTNNAMMEHITRGITVRMGGVGHIAVYPMTGKQMKESSIHGTTTLLIDIGKAILEARAHHVNPFQAMSKVLANSNYGAPIVLFEGKIIDVDRTTVEGFTCGTVTLEGIGDYYGNRFQIKFQNENLIAYFNNEVIATVPDLITLLDIDTYKPITTEMLRFGYRVTCVAIATPPIMRSEQALKIWGPRYFGLDLPFTPVEELACGIQKMRHI